MFNPQKSKKENLSCNIHVTRNPFSCPLREVWDLFVAVHLSAESVLLSLDSCVLNYKLKQFISENVRSPLYRDKEQVSDFRLKGFLVLLMKVMHIQYSI